MNSNTDDLSTDLNIAMPISRLHNMNTRIYIDTTKKKIRTRRSHTRDHTPIKTKSITTSNHPDFNASSRARTPAAFVIFK